MRGSFFLFILLMSMMGCSPEPTPPHIFVFLVDTLRADHSSLYGYHRSTTPALEEFAKDAITFEKASSSSPWTRPAIASLFTGLPPSLHGVRGRQGWLPPEAESLAERLTTLGYSSSAFYTNGNLDPNWGMQQGFSHYDFVQSEQDGESYAPASRLMDAWRNRIESGIEEGPVFHYLHLLDPHRPYRAPRRFRRPFINQPVPWGTWMTAGSEKGPEMRRAINEYDAEILHADASFADFINELKVRGWYEDSWIVFTSDHGEEFMEHGHHGHGNGLFEALLRVPLVIRPPGGKEGSHFAALDLLRKKELPVHAVSDLIGGLTWEDWMGLGRANLVALGHAPGIPEAWLPIPERLGTPLRRASLNLDGRGAFMVADSENKLIFEELPQVGWSWYRPAQDRFERVSLGEDGPELLHEELLASYAATAQGQLLQLEADGEYFLRISPPDALREVRRWPGHSNGDLAWIRAGERGGVVRWSGMVGDRIVLNLANVAAMEFRMAEGKWESGLPGGVAKGPWLGPHPGELGSPGAMSPELRQQLEALGYL